jgi:signal transduction histidine kinase
VTRLSGGEVVTVSSEVLEAAIALSPDAVLVVDAAGAVVGANGVACQLFGYADALGGFHLSRVLLPVDAPGAAPGGGSTPASCTGRRRHGDTFPAEIMRAPVRVEGALLELIVVRDRSDAAAVLERAVLAEAAARGARELHDAVLQRLFGSGLVLESLVPHATSAAVAERLAAIVAELADTVAELRAALGAASEGAPRAIDAPGVAATGVPPLAPWR